MTGAPLTVRVDKLRVDLLSSKYLQKISLRIELSSSMLYYYKR